MPSTARTCVAFANLSQIGEASFEVAAGLDAAEVPVVLIRADDVLALAEGIVGDHLDRGAHRADRASLRTERLPDLLGLGGPEVLAKRGEQLHLVEPIVAAYQREHDATVRHDRHRLRCCPRVDAEELRDVLYRPLSRGLDFFGPWQRFGEVGCRRDAPGDLEVRGVVAVLARDERVLARAGGCEEVPASAPAHDP